jgi:sugar phosphate isomerase/epimerase
MARSRHLSLDHLTIVDATPEASVEAADRADFDGVCLFLESMSVLPDMPEYSLIKDAPARRAVRDALRSRGLSLDLVYPFTLAGRTVIADFEPTLETAAWLGGSLANVLLYDRDPARRSDALCELAELASNYGIGLAVEFYPVSRIRSLGEATALVRQTGRDNIGLTLDILHLMRSGEPFHASDARICIAQLSDGPATASQERIEWEASHERSLPGAGSFDIAGFVAALPVDCPLSLEVPRQSALRAAVAPLERAIAVSRALAAVLDHTSDARVDGAEDLCANG